MLTDKIHLLSRTSPSASPTPEDILSSALAVIFPDDITNQHGDASSSVIYASPAFGRLELSLADPEGDVHRRLFSHFLWNAGVQVAEFVEEGEGQSWIVQGKRVLELGAGTGLAGILAALKGAAEVVISDFPAPEVLANLEANVRRNVEPRREKGEQVGFVRVVGHCWGILEEDEAFARGQRGSFDVLLVADCLWMPWEHGNLHKSIAWFLKDDGRAWVVAGFHTGREKMRGFFEEEALTSAGLEIERLWERNAEGVERAWVRDRGIEDVTERKRWLVVGILKRKAV